MPSIRQTSRRLLACPLRLAGLAAIALLVAGASRADASRPPWARGDTLQPVFPGILLSPEEAARRADRLRWLDARPREVYERGHVPGAISLDPDHLPWVPGRLAAALGAAGVESDRDLITYADGPHTAAAGELLWLLEVAGARRVFVLNGGLEAWQMAGGGIERESRRLEPTRFAAQPDTGRWADAAYVRRVAGLDGYEILEARSEEEWARGHIPHALPFPADSLWGHSIGLRPAQELWNLFSQFGPRPRDPISLGDEILVCMQGGAPSALSLYLAAREAGIGRVRGYAGGFASWRRDETAPVVRIVDGAEVKAKLGGRSWWDKLTGQKRPKLLVFDVRSQRDYAVGHLPGAVSLPSHRFAEEFEDFLAEHWPDIDRAKTPILFYCYGPTCIRSRHCSSIAARHGFRDLLWFREGIEGWYAIGERLVRE